MTLEVRVLAAELASVMGVSFRYLAGNGRQGIIRAYRSAFHLKWKFKLTHHPPLGYCLPRATGV